ncbi:MAG TPA: AAA family ATPase [Phycisphaerae bacterium]|nr:AAA family ATPase [Phycisphaerales bacterium]HRX85986.1 AAA family ATPase [Phycisphaerae bacterium]
MSVSQETRKPQRRNRGRDELEVLIRARYPIVYVISWEEGRVEQHLREIASRRSKELHCWSVTTGLQKSGSPRQARSKGLADPVEALDVVIEHKEPALYLFKDFHPFMRAREGNAAVIRKLREVAMSLSDSYKSLIITSPLLDIAPELEKDVTVLDYPLPDTDDFAELLQRICRDVADNPKVTVALADQDREKLIQAALGLTLQEAENVFAKTIVQDGRLDAGDVSVVFSEKQQIIRKSGLLEYYASATDMGDVGGLDHLKEWLDKRAHAFTDRARRFGLPAPKGVLLLGVQGCGKSLCAKAVARMWNMPLLRFDMGRMFASLVGSSEENIRRAISVAESIAPVVLWADEIDKAFAGSQGSANTDGGTTARVMSTFLTWLSEKQKPVFVLATANNITQLPPELLRKGRLDEIFFVDLPNADERVQVFTIHLRKRRRDPAKFDLAQLAAAAEGFSGAEIEEAVISALYDVFYLDKELETSDLLKSVKETVPLSKTMHEGIASLRAWADGRARYASRRDDEEARRKSRKLEM